MISIIRGSTSGHYYVKSFGLFVHGTCPPIYEGTGESEAGARERLVAQVPVYKLGLDRGGRFVLVQPCDYIRDSRLP